MVIYIHLFIASIVQPNFGVRPQRFILLSIILIFSKIDIKVIKIYIDVWKGYDKIIDKSINLCGRAPKLGCTIDAMNK